MNKTWIIPPSEEVRLLAIEMVETGEAPDEVATLLGVSDHSVWRWLSRWRTCPDAGLSVQPGRGRPPKLSSAQAAEVLAWLDHKATAFHFPTDRWTAPRVAALIRQHWGVVLHPRYLNDWLTRHGVSPQLPQAPDAERKFVHHLVHFFAGKHGQNEQDGKSQLTVVNREAVASYSTDKQL